MLALFVAVPIGLIVGIVKLIKIPRPPEGFGRSELNWWYFGGGWKKAQRAEELRRLIEEDEMELQRIWDEEEIEIKPVKGKEDEAFYNEIRNYLKLGQRMEAIKRYQERYGCSFDMAKYEIYEIDYQAGYERINESETPR
jgi:hypothetical protein